MEGYIDFVVIEKCMLEAEAAIFDATMCIFSCSRIILVVFVRMNTFISEIISDRATKFGRNMS